MSVIHGDSVFQYNTKIILPPGMAEKLIALMEQAQIIRETGYGSEATWEDAADGGDNGSLHITFVKEEVILSKLTAGKLAG